MIYWLNRRVERAIEAYLKTIVPDTIPVYRRIMTPHQFPCMHVRAHQNQRFTGSVYACNRMLAGVRVITEYADTIDAAGSVLEQFEDIEERAVSYALEALYVDDLAAQLNAQAISGLHVSYAVPGGDSSNPVTSVSSEDGTVSIVEIPLIIHAGATAET